MKPEEKLTRIFRINDTEMNMDELEGFYLTKPDPHTFLKSYYHDLNFFAQYTTDHVYDDDHLFSIEKLYTIFFNMYLQKFGPNYDEKDIIDLNHYYVSLSSFLIINAHLFYDNEIKLICKLLVEISKEKHEK